MHRQPGSHGVEASEYKEKYILKQLSSTGVCSATLTSKGANAGTEHPRRLDHAAGCNSDP
jgi:hypothetical protein